MAFDDVVGFCDAAVFPGDLVGESKVDVVARRAMFSFEFSVADDCISVFGPYVRCYCEVFEGGEDGVVKGGECFFGRLVTWRESSYLAIVREEFEDRVAVTLIPYAFEPRVVQGFERFFLFHGRLSGGSRVP